MVCVSLGGMVETIIRILVPNRTELMGLPEDVLDWCESNCSTYITNNGTYSQDEGLVFTYYIKDSTERALFRLTWGDYVI